jgi:MprA protease rhombosortase-interaction domain-containing protein
MKRTPIRPAPSRADLERFGPAPREVRLTASGWTVTVFAIAFVVAAVAAALGFPILRAHQQEARDRALREAVRTDAVITDVKVNKGEHPRRRVTFRYSAPDGEHESAVRLDEDDDRETVAGGRLTIAYLRSDPSRSWIAGGEPGVMPLWLIPLIPAALLLVAGLIAYALRRDCVLLSEGRFTTARVIASKKVSHSHGHSYRVNYEFTTMSGATVTAATDRSRPLAAGTTTVPVVYHRENARWNAVFPLSLATPCRR